jgi:hypothetical protein
VILVLFRLGTSFFCLLSTSTGTDAFLCVVSNPIYEVLQRRWGTTSSNWYDTVRTVESIGPCGSKVIERAAQEGLRYPQPSVRSSIYACPKNGMPAGQ